MQTVEKCHLWLWGEFLRVISASVSHFKLITERLWNKPCECFALLRVVLHSSVLLLGNLSWFWAVCKLSLNTAGCGAIYYYFFFLRVDWTLCFLYCTKVTWSTRSVFHYSHSTLKLFLFWEVFSVAGLRPAGGHSVHLLIVSWSTLIVGGENSKETEAAAHLSISL